MERQFLFSVGLCAAFVLGANAAEKVVDISKVAPPVSKQGVTFDSDVKPIFEKSCFKCHGPETPKPKGRFRADSKAAVLKGGEGGAVITPGNSAKSYLLAMVAQAAADPDECMPPKGNRANIPPLTKEQVGVIRAWIEQGAN